MERLDAHSTHGRRNSKTPPPVLIFAKSGEVEELKRFLTTNHVEEDLSLIVDKYGQTMLHVAVEEGHVDMCKYLIYKRHFNVNAQDRNGWTPLHVACSKGDCRLVAMLLATSKCDASLKTVEGATVLRYLVRREPQKNEWEQEMYYLLIKQIIACGCDPEARNSNGETALHAAAAAGRTPMVIYLSRLGVDINSLTKHGETCLHLAARRGDIEMAQALLTLGIDASVKGLSGTATDVSQAAGHENMCKLLSQYALPVPEMQAEFVAQAITTAQETKMLNLSHLGLTSIPSQAWNHLDVVEIDLSYNNLTEVPPQIVLFTMLKSLKLHGNRLATLPPEMGNMAHLEELTLSLNTELSPIIKRKLRESLPSLLDYLRSGGDIPQSPHKGKGSAGDDVILDLVPETPEEERLIHVLEQREKRLNKKEKKLSAAAALVQEKTENVRAMLATIKHKEEKLKAKEKELRKLAHEFEQQDPSKRKSTGDSSLVMDNPLSEKADQGSWIRVGGAQGINLSIHTNNDLFLRLSSSSQDFTITLAQWQGLVKLMSYVDTSILLQATLSSESAQHACDV